MGPLTRHHLSKVAAGARTLAAAGRSSVAQLAERAVVSRRVVGSNPTRGAIVLACLLLVGCANYPGTATTVVKYYSPDGKMTAEITQTTAWRQATVTAPGPLPELAPLVAANANDEYALVVASFYEETNRPPPGDVAANHMVSAVSAAVRARAILIQHEEMGGGLEAWGSGAIGLLMGWLTGGIL